MSDEQHKSAKKVRSLPMAAIYTVIVLAVLWWSGHSREFVSFDGYVIQCQDCEKLRAFYHTVLDLSERDPTKADMAGGNETKLVGFVLPDGRSLWLSPSATQPISTPTNSGTTAGTPNIATKALSRAAFVFRVRSGLSALHSEIAKRLQQKPISISNQKNLGANDISTEIQPSQISEISKYPWGREFVLRDPEGNLFRYYQSAEKSFSRF